LLSSGSDSDCVSTGDAAGGWGEEHNHEITHHDTSLVKSYQKEISKPYPNTSYTPYSPADKSHVVWVAGVFIRGIMI
jgi:hypothetical protein